MISARHFNKHRILTTRLGVATAFAHCCRASVSEALAFHRTLTRRAGMASDAGSLYLGSRRKLLCVNRSTRKIRGHCARWRRRMPLAADLVTLYGGVLVFL